MSCIWAGLPAGCVSRLYQTGDLLAARKELEASKVWIAKSLLGMVESIRGENRAAEAAFAAARRESRLAESNAPGERLRRVLHRMLKVEHRIAVGLAPEPKGPSIAKSVKGIRQLVGDAASIYSQRLGLEACLFLCAGKFLRALEAYEAVLDCGVGGHGIRALWHIGMGVSLWEIGQRRASLRSLESAGLHTMADGRAFAVLRNATRLSAIYFAMGRERLAEQWAEQAERSSCPAETIESSKRRADALLFHATQRGHMVVY